MSVKSDLNYSSSNYGEYLKYTDPNYKDGQTQEPPTSPLYPTIDKGGVAQSLKLTQEIHNQTINLLAKANEISQNILQINNPRPSPYAPHFQKVVDDDQKPTFKSQTTSPVYIDLSNRSWSMFNRETHVHHHHHHDKDTKKEDKENDSSQRVLVGLVGFIVAAASAFFIGKAMSAGEEAQEESMNFEDLKKSWTYHKSCYDPQFQNTVDRIVNRADAILQRKQSNRVHKIALLVFAFASGASGLLGALMNYQLLMKTGIVIGTITSFGALYRLGYQYTNTKDQKDAKVIDFDLLTLSTLPQPVVTV